MAQILRADKTWTERLSRSGYFLAALLLHLIVFVMVATWIIFPAFKPPVDDFTKTYLPPPSPPPPPPSSPQTVQMPTHVVAPPTQVITTTAPSMDFTVPMPDFTTQITPDAVTQKMEQKAVTPTDHISDVRLAQISQTEKGWGRDSQNIRDSMGDPRNIVAKFPVYVASYADGDWDCNIVKDDSGKIVAGSIPNFVAKMNEWSHGKITGEVVPEPLAIGGPDLMDKKPPFIFFTGHRDFKLTEQEVQNLRDYLQVGGAIWGDNALAGRGSRFDVAFHREMKRVVPDADKNFEPVDMTDDIFTKSWFPISKMPEGMNYYAEPMERLDIDGELAILYTPNDYSDLFFIHILPGDTVVDAGYRHKYPLYTNFGMWERRGFFFRNMSLESSLAAQQLGMNIVGYLLVRFDKKLMLTP
jgi:hypothetical protein